MKKIKRLLKELEGVQEATWGWSFEIFSISTIQVRRDGQVVHTNTKKGAIEFLKAEIAKHKPVESWTPKLGGLALWEGELVVQVVMIIDDIFYISLKTGERFEVYINVLTQPTPEQIKKAMRPVVGELCWFWGNLSNFPVTGLYEGLCGNTYHKKGVTGYAYAHSYWITPLAILQQLEKERKK